MRHALFESFAGFDDFLVYLAVAVAYFAVYLAIYVRITPYPEIQLIRSGNVAAAYSLSGSALGFAIPLASAVANSVNLVDMALWALIAMAVQVCVYVAVKLMIPHIARDISEGHVAQGMFLGTLSLAVGLLNAACMTY
jgi:putative membrane protein